MTRLWSARSFVSCVSLSCVSSDVAMKYIACAGELLTLAFLGFHEFPTSSVASQLMLYNSTGVYGCKILLVCILQLNNRMHSILD